MLSVVKFLDFGIFAYRNDDISLFLPCVNIPVSLSGLLPMFNNKPTNFISYSLFSRALNLPSYHDISGDDIERVVKHIRSSLEI